MYYIQTDLEYLLQRGLTLGKMGAYFVVEKSLFLGSEDTWGLLMGMAENFAVKASCSGLY